MLQDLNRFFAGLKDLVSEPVRATIVRRFCSLMAAKLRENKPAYRQWLERDQRRFITNCEIVDGLKAVPDDLHIAATDLSRFCDFWLTVQQYRSDKKEEFRPITPEMNSLRVTMIKQLQGIANGTFSLDDLTKQKTDGSLEKEDNK